MGPQLLVEQTELRDLGARERLVVGAGLGLGRGSDQRGRQLLVLAQAIGQLVTVEDPLALRVALPE